MARMWTTKVIFSSLLGISVVSVLIMIGWSSTGRHYRINSTELSLHVERYDETDDGRLHRYSTDVTAAQTERKPSGHGMINTNNSRNSIVTAGRLDAKTRWFAEQARRQSTLRHACKSYRKFGEKRSLSELTKRKSRFLYFIVNDKHRLLYTWVAKVASANWMRAFLVLKGKYKRVEDVPFEKIGKSSLLILGTNFSREGIRHRLDNYTNFIFVRHPFERLLTAYRKKLEEKNYYYPKHLGREIIMRYRKHATAKALRAGTGVTFPEFVKYLVNANRSKLDHHWRPIYKFVLPCTVRFDYIGKLETGEEDAKHILQETHTDHLVHFKPTHRNVSHDQAMFNHYYSQVPSVDLARLYLMYRPDFELFGYQIPESMQNTFNFFQ